MEEKEPLDILDVQEELSYELATSGQRFGNLLIDSIIIQVPTYFITASMATQTSPGAVFQLYGITLLMYFAYYTIFEFTTGRTPGKWVTNTQVLREADLGKISINQAIGRSLSRMVPFEAFSFFGSAKGWHDRWTNTVVVKSNSLQNRN